MIVNLKNNKNKYKKKFDNVQYIKQDYYEIDKMPEWKRKKALENFNRIITEKWR